EKNYWMAPDSNLALIIPRKAYYQDAFVWLEKVKVPKAPSGGEILSDCYHIYPEDIPTRKGLSFAFRFKNDFPLTKDIGVYKYNSKKEKWQSIRSKIPDPTRKFIDIKGLNGGIISVIRDIEPPELIKSYPGPGGNYRLKDINRKIWFQLEDNLSGFGDGGNINIYIDGEWKVFYYNAVTKVVTIDNPNLKSGPHTIQLLIEDKAGNLLDKRINFNTIR
ncbi:MAG: hypothetical protein KAI81_00505, partial [Candidatus Marinimicrobia bacterium]|nr:hypothetical protein [Candidatus Neomarinimicrobiota bacterium]